MLWRLIIGAHKAEPLCATPPVYRIRGKYSGDLPRTPRKTLNQN
jgi:hypothetical protein